MNARRPRILIVEESALSRETTEQALEPLCADTMHVEDGYEALQLLGRDADFDLAVIGMSMEDMSGLELTRLIKLDPELGDIPVILKATDLSAIEYQEAFRSGVTEVLAADEDAHVFRATVESRLGIRKRRRKPILLTASPKVKNLIRDVLLDSGLPTFEVSEVHDATDVLPKLVKLRLAFVDFRLPAVQACVFLRFIRNQKEYENLRLVLMLHENCAKEVLETMGGGAEHYVIQEPVRDHVVDRIRALSC